jgi:hypothetical protein
MKYTATHESSMIQSSTYDTQSLELIVTFNGGNSYTYNGVAESDYNSFVSAESTGKGFNEYIRKYEGQKLLTEVNGDDLKTDNNSNLLLG